MTKNTSDIQMETADNEREELKKLAPRLFANKKSDGFEVPENYFESLPQQMQEKVHSRIKPKSYWVPDYKLAFATLAILFTIGAGIKFFNGSNSSKNELAGKDLMQVYTNSYLAASDEYELADQLDDELLELTAQEIEKESEPSNSEIEAYLLNDIDITTLTNEF